MTMVLLCQADIAVQAMAQAGLTGQERSWAKGNQHERFHHLPPVSEDVDLAGEGIADLILDFKRFFAMPAQELAARVTLLPAAVGRADRRATLISPYKEEVLVRFHNYHGRVAVPDAMPSGTPQQEG